MSTKDERLEVRLSKADRSLIEDAAKKLNESVSDFTRGAVIDRAQHVVARADVVLMPAAQFDELLDALDQPDEAPVLERAFARPRQFRRG